jgi:hypothetical protein
MFLLLDHGVPGPIRAFRTQDMGCDRLTNGELLSATEEAGLGVLITTDKNIRCQQNLTDRKIAIVVIGNAQ